jgi:Protein of unknown function (DUF805)
VLSADAFLSFAGRLDRERWRVAVALLILANLATVGLTWWLTAQGLLPPAGRDRARLFVQVFTLVPWLAIDWKRFHDPGRPGALALICPGLYGASRLWETPAVAAHAARLRRNRDPALLGAVRGGVVVDLRARPGVWRRGSEPVWA